MHYHFHVVVIRHLGNILVLVVLLCGDLFCQMAFLGYVTPRSSFEFVVILRVVEDLDHDLMFHAPTGCMNQRSMLTRSVVAIYWIYIAKQ